MGIAGREDGIFWRCEFWTGFDHPMRVEEVVSDRVGLYYPQIPSCGNVLLLVFTASQGNRRVKSFTHSLYIQAKKTGWRNRLLKQQRRTNSERRLSYRYIGAPSVRACNALVGATRRVLDRDFWNSYYIHIFEHRASSSSFEH